MSFDEDPRIRIARRCFRISWIFYFAFLLAVMAASFGLGIKPYVLGLPRWVAFGNLIIPSLFVVLLIFVAEKLIPDVPLTDEDTADEEDRN